MSFEYLRDYYKQKMLEFRCSSEESEKWELRKAMAKTEECIRVLYGANAVNQVRQEVGLPGYTL